MPKYGVFAVVVDKLGLSRTQHVEIFPDGGRVEGADILEAPTPQEALARSFVSNPLRSGDKSLLVGVYELDVPDEVWAIIQGNRAAKEAFLKMYIQGLKHGMAHFIRSPAGYPSLALLRSNGAVEIFCGDFENAWRRRSAA